MTTKYSEPSFKRARGKWRGGGRKEIERHTLSHERRWASDELNHCVRQVGPVRIIGIKLPSLAWAQESVINNGENAAPPSTAGNYFFLSSTLLSSARCSNFQTSQPKLLDAKLLPRDTVVFARKCRKLEPLLHEHKILLNAILCKKKLFCCIFLINA